MSCVCVSRIYLRFSCITGCNEIKQLLELSTIVMNGVGLFISYCIVLCDGTSGDFITSPVVWSLLCCLLNDKIYQLVDRCLRCGQNSNVLRVRTVA